MIWHSFFFLLFASLACLFAAMVVVTGNVVRMAFYLVLSLSATAGLFFLAGADFVGAMQLMIYVGGTLVLLIFGVMLTAQEEFVRMPTRPTSVLLAALVGAALLVLLSSAAFRVPAWHGDTPRTATLDQPPRTVGPIALALLGMRVDGPADAAAGSATADGRVGYLLAFDVVSVHLLVVLVGAAYLARTRISKDSLAARPPGGLEDTDEPADAPAPPNEAA